MKINIHQGLCYQCPCPHGEVQPTLTSVGDPLRPLWQILPKFLWRYCFVLCSRPCETLCAPSKSRVSVSPSPVELLSSSPTGLQGQRLQNSSSQCQTVRLFWRAIFMWEHLCVVCMCLILLFFLVWPQTLYSSPYGIGLYIHQSDKNSSFYKSPAQMKR